MQVVWNNLLTGIATNPLPFCAASNSDASPFLTCKAKIKSQPYSASREPLSPVPARNAGLTLESLATPSLIDFRPLSSPSEQKPPRLSVRRRSAPELDPHCLPSIVQPVRIGLEEQKAAAKMSSDKKSDDFVLRMPERGDSFREEKDSFLERRQSHRVSAPGLHDKLAKVQNNPGVSILAYCLSSISMTVVNKYCVSGKNWNLNLFYLAVQVWVDPRKDTLNEEPANHRSSLSFVSLPL